MNARSKEPETDAFDQIFRPVVSENVSHPLWRRVEKVLANVTRGML